MFGVECLVLSAHCLVLSVQCLGFRVYQMRSGVPQMSAISHPAAVKMNTPAAKPPNQVSPGFTVSFRRSAPLHGSDATGVTAETKTVAEVTAGTMAICQPAAVKMNTPAATPLLKVYLDPALWCARARSRAKIGELVPRTQAVNL